MIELLSKQICRENESLEATAFRGIEESLCLEGFYQKPQGGALIEILELFYAKRN